MNSRVSTPLSPPGMSSTPPRSKRLSGNYDPQANDIDASLVKIVMHPSVEHTTLHYALTMIKLKNIRPSST
jgi:hypothetical protein